LYGHQWLKTCEFLGVASQTYAPHSTKEAETLRPLASTTDQVAPLNRRVGCAARRGHINAQSAVLTPNIPLAWIRARWLVLGSEDNGQ
jgi:hypothetical protein